ncbi:hypothetical protein VTJ04DRAFT_1328 [Mycothermus thermophilus]|uniref:uncharacterized protein n=1 Tax=Humicola insolens TaxID=85995 RepID=UPI003744081C
MLSQLFPLRSLSTTGIGPSQLVVGDQGLFSSSKSSERAWEGSFGTGEWEPERREHASTTGYDRNVFGPRNHRSKKKTLGLHRTLGDSVGLFTLHPGPILLDLSPVHRHPSLEALSPDVCSYIEGERHSLKSVQSPGITATSRPRHPMREA